MKDLSFALDPTAGAPDAAERRSRLLVVDADGTTRDGLLASLRAAGHEVRDARDLDGGLRITRDYRPDLALCSWSPPQLDATEYCRRVKNDPGLRSTHVTLLCGDPVAGLDAGADGVLVRPFGDEELHAHVRAGLRVRQELRELADDQHRAALIELAATLGHEINNPLTALFGHMELVLHYLESGDSYRMQHHLREAGQVASRIGQVAQRLMHMVEPKTKTYLDQVRMLDL